MVIAMRYCILFYIFFLCMTFVEILPQPSVQPAFASAPIGKEVNAKSNFAHGVANLRIVSNYIFWYEYSYDLNRVSGSYINGIDGMSDHGYTHELKAGGSISIFAEYAATENPRRDFLDTVRGCKKNHGERSVQVSLSV